MVFGVQLPSSSQDVSHRHPSFSTEATCSEIHEYQPYEFILLISVEV
jgi:hypothetical protein